MRTHKTILFLFLALLVFLIINSVLTFRNYRILDSNNALVLHTQQVMVSLDDVRERVNRTNDLVRSYFGKGKAPVPEDFDRVLDQVQEGIGEVRQKTIDNPIQTGNADTMIALVQEQRALFHQLVRSPRQNGYTPLRDRITEVSAKIRDILSLMRREEDRLLGNRTDETQQSIEKTRLGFFIARSLVFLFIVTAMMLFEREARIKFELQKTQKALLISENDYRKAVESIRDIAILNLDLEGKVRTFNEGAQNLKGYKSGEVLGRHFSIFYTEEDRDSGVPGRVLAQALEKGRAEAEGWRVRKDGTRFYALTILSLLKDDQGKPRGFVKVTRDFTARKKMEDEIHRSNAFLSAVLENIPNMIFVKDAKELRFVMFNKAGEELLGMGRDKLIGKNDYDFFPKDQADHFTAKDREVLEKGTLLDIPEEPIETQGGKRFLHTKKIPIRDGEGKLSYLLGISEDITDGKEAQRVIQEKTELLDSILANIGDGVVAADEKGAFLIFNPAAEKIVGIGATEGGPGQWTEKYGVYLADGTTPCPPEDNPLARAIRGESTREVVLLLKNPPNPEGVLVSVTSRPLKDKNGKDKGGVAIFRDITEQRRREEREIYTRALEVSNRELQDFVFVASHDLQEPLRKIQSFGEFLQREEGRNLGPNGNDYLTRMRNAASRMQRLINDLLALTRVTTKAQPFVRVDLRKVLEGVLSDLETRVRETGAKVELGDLPVLEADETQIRQLFQNLIGNALKFHRPGVPPVVRITATLENGARDRGESCRILVEDNGIGFDNRYAEQIFKVFERLHGKDEYEGTGIGLSICRKVVERHGGTIRAEGEPGRGSRFLIEIPARGRS